MSCYRISARQIAGMYVKFKWDKKNNEEIFDAELLEREVARINKIGYEAYLVEKNETISSFIRRLNKSDCYINPITSIMVMEA